PKWWNRLLLWISRVDGVEREIQSRRRFHHFGTRSFQLSAHFFMLCLSGLEVRRMVKAELPPASDTLRLVPARRAWRAHQHALQLPDHGMAVEKAQNRIRSFVCHNPE